MLTKFVMHLYEYDTFAIHILPVIRPVLIGGVRVVSVQILADVFHADPLFPLLRPVVAVALLR